MNKIIRKIDTIGRIVIPKEYREALNIREYDDLLLILDKDKIIINKYSYIKDYSTFVEKIVSCFNKLDYTVLISDRNKIINNSKYIGKNIDLFFRNMLNVPQKYISSFEETHVIGEDNLKGYYYIEPIYKDNSCIGLIIIISISSDLVMADIISSVIKNIVENINLL